MRTMSRSASRSGANSRVVPSSANSQPTCAQISPLQSLVAGAESPRRVRVAGLVGMAWWRRWAATHSRRGTPDGEAPATASATRSGRTAQNDPG